MKDIFLFLMALLVMKNTTAQDQVLKLDSKRLDNQNVEISYKKNKPGNYTIALKFSTLTNTTQSFESVSSINNSSGTLLTLRPSDKEKGIDYNFTFNYIPGKLKPDVKEDFCYILPYKPGEKVSVVEMGYANEKFFGAQKQSGWKSYSMSTKQSETVTAIRKGEVVDIVDTFEDANSENVAFTTSKNHLIVEHEDGTLLRYSGFKRGSIAVQLGDGVVPGSVLGINSPNQNANYSISLLLYYLSSANFESLQGQTLSNPKSLYTILTPMFTLDGIACTVLENRKEYSAFNSEEIITREMSKKELKKYQGTQGK